MEVIRNALIRRLSGLAKSEGSRKMSTQVVLITGALTGIGRAVAVAFAREGHRIAVAGRHEEAGQALVTELRALGADVEFLRADVRHEDDVRTMVDRAVARFGRLDAAVNNAGTEGQPGPVTQQTANSYAATFDTNVLGTLLSMKHELRVMQAQGSGSIVNISSTYGHEGAAGASVYAASKHAVEGMTRSAALEAARFGVRVNAVAPGPTETGMLNRFTGTSERKASLAAGVPLGRVGGAGRDCSRDRVPGFRQRVIRDGTSSQRRRRQDRWLTMAASASSSRRTSVNRSQEAKEIPCPS
jgi:NAD(P)-dependent dehydrogenase (short-subunit alcohol dehydrogenase family)